METTSKRSQHTPENLPESLAASDNYSYKEREWRAPKIDPDETILFDEPGRVLGRGNGSAVDCRSHYFRVTKPRFGFYRLRVRHGGGEEKCCLKYDSRIIDALQQMDSDSRFWLLWTIMDVQHDAQTQTAERVTTHWQTAAAEKRIKTRKVRAGVKVWIETPIASVKEAA